MPTLFDTHHDDDHHPFRAWHMHLGRDDMPSSLNEFTMDMRAAADACIVTISDDSNGSADGSSQENTCTGARQEQQQVRTVGGQLGMLPIQQQAAVQMQVKTETCSPAQDDSSLPTSPFRQQPTPRKDERAPPPP